MFIRGLPLVIPLWFLCFTKDSFCVCGARTTWAKVGWEILPEEVSLMQLTPPRSYLPYPLDQLGHNFWGSTKLPYIVMETLFVLLTILSGHYLWTKGKKNTTKPEENCSSNDVQENQCTDDTDQILWKLMLTATILSRYVDQVSQQSPKKSKHRRKIREKKGCRHTRLELPTVFTHEVKSL
ncbi:testis-expressed protein 50 [Macrotis lagotis]|uniref:testis-expressed protein 50 n=1 Tax=Macrotis lagotis TaxID=92651 RepID=UPI003D69DF86